MVMASTVGFTCTVTVAGALAGAPAAELVATTLKVSTGGAARAGTLGATKVCVEPSAAVAVNATAGPAVWVQVKVRVPLFGSTPVAVRVMREAPSPGAGFGVALAVTPGADPGGGTLMGTITLAMDAVWFTPPTVSWKLRLVGLATLGATKVAVALLALLMVTMGLPGFTTCAHTNGPAPGKLPVECSVTNVPETMGLALAVKLATAWAAEGSPGLQTCGGGATLSGQGFNCPIFCVG